MKDDGMSVGGYERDIGPNCVSPKRQSPRDRAGLRDLLPRRHLQKQPQVGIHVGVLQNLPTTDFAKGFMSSAEYDGRFPTKVWQPLEVG